MSIGGWSTVLVLGGIRSGRVAFAESLVTDAPAVRYIGTGTGDRAGAEDLSGEPARLPAVVAEAKPDEVLFVDDLAGWVSALLAAGGPDEPVPALARALRDTPGRVVLVSPEVGLSLAPATTPDRTFIAELGTANRALAEVCDAVVLVVAGQPVWLKTPVAGRRTPVVVPAPGATDRPVAAVSTEIKPGMALPMPDEEAAADARGRLTTLDLPGAGLGALAGTVAFAAATQGVSVPEPWRAVRVLLLHGDHDGGAAAGDSPAESARRVALARAGEGPLALLAAEAGAGVQVVPAPAARAMESVDALTDEEVDAALALGWRLADEAADSGADLLILGACGAGSDAAAAAVIASTTAAEPVRLLARVVSAGGRIDDNAWMVRCATLRDALHRVRQRPRGARELLAGLGGGDIAVATGVLLGAAARRTPVLLDGPVGVAAGLVSRELGGQARHWCLLPDAGGHPGVRQAAEVLDLHPVLDLRLGLGEGAGALAALPLLRTALTLAAAAQPAG